MSDKDNKDAEDREEYRKGLWGFLKDVASVGFWGTLALGIGAAITWAIMGKEGVQKNFGLAGMHLVNGIGSIFGKEIYSEKDMQDYFMSLEDTEAAKIFEDGLTRTGLDLGGELVAEITKGNEDSKNAGSHRDITTKLLANAGFKFSDLESINNETLTKFLTGAFQGAHLTPGSNEHKYTVALLEKAKADLTKAKTSSDPGTWQKVKSFFSGIISGDDKDRGNAVLQGDILAKILKHFPDQGVELFAAMTEDAEVSKMILAQKDMITQLAATMNEAQLAALSGLVGKLMAQDDKAKAAELLSTTLTNPEFLQPFTDQQEAILSHIGNGIKLMNDPNYQAFFEANAPALSQFYLSVGAEESMNIINSLSQVFAKGDFTASSLLENPTLLQAFSDHQEALGTLLKNLNKVDALPNSAKADTFRQWLFASSSEAGVSNYQVIASAANNPDLMKELGTIVDTLTEGKNIDALAVSENAAALFNRLNLNYDEFAAILAPEYARIYNETAAERLNSQATRAVLNLNNLAAGIGLFGAEKIERNIDADTKLKEWQEQLPSLTGVTGGEETAVLGSGDDAIIDNILDEYILQPAVQRHKEAAAGTARE